MNLVHEISQRQLPEILELEDTSLGIFEKFTSHKDEFIQIDHGNRHWIVVEGKEEEHAVEIYDSKEDSPSNMSAPQDNEVDCDIFAIKFAIKLVFGESPEKKLLEPNSMRSHLSECLKKEEFFLFPSTKRKQIKTNNYLGLLDIYYPCRKPFFEENTEKRQRELYDYFLEVWSVVS